MTDEDDGLLLYAGPLATLQSGEAEDYMAIGKGTSLPIISCVPRGPRVISALKTWNLILSV